MRDFKDKVAVITGAASGIGLELARAFSREGAKLALADVNAAGLAAVKRDFEAQGRPVYIQTVDVTKKEQIKDFCDNVYQTYGRVDILCNNAGIGMGGKFEDMDLGSWEKIIAVNLWSVIYGCHYFYPRMMRQGGGGHIVNTASFAGLAPLALMTAYCTTKFGVEGFTETLRAEAALHGIGVTSVCPGFVKTNITVTTQAFTGTKKTPNTGDLMKKVDALYVWKNYTPDRVAAKVLKGVKRNAAVVRICPETYMGDLTHTLSRTFSIFQAQKILSLMMKWL